MLAEGQWGESNTLTFSVPAGQGQLVHASIVILWLTEHTTKEIGKHGKGKISIPQGSPCFLVVSGCVVVSPHTCFSARSTSTVAMHCMCGRFLTSVLKLGQNVA